MPHRLLAVPKTRTHPLRQIAVATGIGLSTLRHRAKGAAVIVVGIGVMVFVLLSILSIVEGLRLTLLNSGDPSRAMIRATNTPQTFQLDRSVLPPQTPAIAAAAPGVARGRDGFPLVDAVSFHGIGLTKRNNGEKGGTIIMGVGPRWPEINPNFHLLSGRMPRPGARELLAGTLAQRKFSGLDGGFADYHGQRWRIVGTFATGGYWDGVLMNDAAVMKAKAGSKTDNIVLVRLSSPAAFAAFKQYADMHLPRSVTTERETEFYANFWKNIPRTAFYIAYLLGALIGSGAFAGTAQTMNDAIMARAREIAILRALGFDGVAVAASAVIEAILLAMLGAFTGTALVWLWLDGFLYNALGVFRITVDLPLLLQAMGWGLAVAVPGVLRPALRLARQTPIEALREV